MHKGSCFVWYTFVGAMIDPKEDVNFDTNDTKRIVKKMMIIAEGGTSIFKF